MKNCFSIIFGIKPQVCQAYILNLLNYLCRQKQMQYLFSSRNLAKSSSPLAFALLLLPYSFDSQALSAKTTSAIEGSAPYLTFDGGRTRATINDVLAITLPDGARVTPSSDTSSRTNPMLVRNISTFDDIHTLVPSGKNTMSFRDLIAQGNWGDDDGDGQGTYGVTADGSIFMYIRDKYGRTVNRSDTVDVCKGPYEVILSSTRHSLITRYGVPRASYLDAQEKTYYINLNQPRVCYARPYLGVSANVAGIWNTYEGFLVQSTSSSSYGLNFPTTGADGLYFYLAAGGGNDVSKLKWAPVTRSGITATVTMVIPNETPDMREVFARVQLSGPRADSTQIQSDNPSPLSRPSLPQVFELEGKDSQGNVVVKYGFKLRQWFVNRSDIIDTVPGQIQWCSSLGYRLPRIKDLTNAKCGVGPDFPCLGVDGATPSSGAKHFQRRIGAGFFTEWGDMNSYPDAGFMPFTGYWTSDVISDNYFDVNTRNGYVARYKSGKHPAVCITP
ncbi:hypothetical protein GA0061081_101288 [Gilliamella bombicola]|uniref:DUF1566 domain-containing protein n=1 Tax=Gilliamella bombicola TaxID=1798182 RepID=A0A1C3Z8G4_9GAMM|nr:hypothetical protein [Gilliamella bombicola]SCB78538.1 hypothetical protein GA0061081_101288 [Gilliamella bombicola]